MQSRIVHRSAAALELAAHELHARVMLSALAINAHPSGLWAAAPGVGSRATEHSAPLAAPMDAVSQADGAVR